MNKIFDKEEFFPVAFNPTDGCNVDDDVIRHQVALNIRRQLPQLMKHQKNSNVVALVCGGPSLEKTKKELVEAYWGGVKVVAVNGAYQWCIDNNIKPSMMIMLDARQFNARFLETPVPGCRYLLAAQCHGDAFDICKDRDVTMFHCCSGGDEEFAMLKEFYFGRFTPITIGTTVAIKAIQVLSMLGFKRQDIFGFDSCWMDGEHHSYKQAENDKDKYMPVWITPEGHPELAEKFFCAPWMMRQAVDFQKLVHERGNDFELRVRGDGLIAATLRLSARVGSITVTQGD